VLSRPTSFLAVLALAGSLVVGVGAGPAGAAAPASILLDVPDTATALVPAQWLVQEGTGTPVHEHSVDPPSTPTTFTLQVSSTTVRVRLGAPLATGVFDLPATAVDLVGTTVPCRVPGDSRPYRVTVHDIAATSSSLDRVAATIDTDPLGTATIACTVDVRYASDIPLPLRPRPRLIWDGPLGTSGFPVPLGEAHLGDVIESVQRRKLRNSGEAPLVVDGVEVLGPHSDDVDAAVTCPPVVARGQDCEIAFLFAPTGFGVRTATVRVHTNGGAIDVPVTGTGVTGYLLAHSDGVVIGHGAAGWQVQRLDDDAPRVVGVASDSFGGFWEVLADGSVLETDAPWYGDLFDVPLSAPIVGMAATVTGEGYWLLGRDGGVFSFGDATFHGSTGDVRLNQPVVGMAATPSGGGYWFVAADGGIFAYGDAGFYGSTGDIRLNQPIVGMTATPTGRGYWLVARDGGVFAFGDATFHGSTGDIRLNEPIVGMASSPTGHGYWFVARDGGVFAFGDAPFLGSDVGTNFSSGDVTGIAGTSPLLAP
jgi:hypothetical protein